MRGMSSTYEVVVACHLRDDTPDTVLDTLRWHLGLIEGLPPGVDEEDHPYPLLEPDPHTNAPGGDFASLRQEPTRGWGLFSRNHWLDDDLGQLITLLDLLAPHAETPATPATSASCTPPPPTSRPSPSPTAHTPFTPNP